MENVWNSLKADVIVNLGAILQVYWGFPLIVQKRLMTGVWKGWAPWIWRVEQKWPEVVSFGTYGRREMERSARTQISPLSLIPFVIMYKMWLLDGKPQKKLFSNYILLMIFYLLASSSNVVEVQWGALYPRSLGCPYFCDPFVISLKNRWSSSILQLQQRAPKIS